MRPDKAVLLVDPPAGLLSGVMDELDDIGFRVVWVPTCQAALEFLAAKPQLALIIASAAATRASDTDFMTRVKDLAPDVRIIWGADSKGPRRQAEPTGRGPDSIIPAPFAPDDVRRAISELLAEHFYPTPVAQAVKNAATEVFGRAREFRVEGGVFLTASQSTLSDLNAIIQFAGGVSGHLVIGMSRQHAEMVYRDLVPGVPTVRLDRVEDLVGELCNQTLGRINTFFLARNVDIVHGTPIFIRAVGSTMRFPGRQPSFALALVEPKDNVRVVLEYYLADVRSEVLDAPPSNVLALDEVRFL